MNNEQLEQYVGKIVEITYNDNTSCKGHLSVYYGVKTEFRVDDFDLHYSFIIKPKRIKKVEVLENE